MKMEYNKCGVCLADNGRAGMLIGNEEKGQVHACLNCHETRTTGALVIYSNLHRTEAEIKRTAAQLENKDKPS